MAGRRCIRMNRKSKLHQRKIKKEKPDKKARRAVLDKKRNRMRAFHDQFRAAISDGTKKKFITLLTRSRDRHPQIAAAATALRVHIRTDYEDYAGKLSDEDKVLLRDYDGNTTLQRARTKYYKHLYEWFITKVRRDGTTTITQQARLFKKFVFEDPNYDIELGPATSFKGAGELIKLAQDMDL
jgi:hypothetical protein